MVSRRHFARSSLVCLALFVLAGCDGAQKAGPAAVKTIEDRFSIKVGDRTVQMQIAAEPAEMEKGLMFRQSMKRDEGMLFVYRSPQQMNFWMHNTDIALDIGYFDPAGELKEIYPMYPHDEKTVSSHSNNLRFALEMNQGWYRQAGIKPGAKIDIQAVKEALRARGLNPENMGIR